MRGWGGKSLIADSSALNHPELRFFVKALPDSIPLNTNWLKVNSGMDLSDRYQSIYKVKNAGWVTSAPAYYSESYIWAGSQGLGKALAIPLGWYNGFGTKDIMTQADSAVPRLYWQGLRWLAGDFRNGCTNPAMPNFDPQARVEDGSCQVLGIRADLPQAPTLVGTSGRRVVFSPSVSGGSRVRLSDLRRHVVWASMVPEPAAILDLPDNLPPGLYFLGIIHGNTSFQARILVP